MTIKSFFFLAKCCKSHFILYIWGMAKRQYNHTALTLKNTDPTIHREIERIVGLERVFNSDEYLTVPTKEDVTLLLIKIGIKNYRTPANHQKEYEEIVRP